VMRCGRKDMQGSGVEEGGLSHEIGQVEAMRTTLAENRATLKRSRGRLGSGSMRWRNGST
jgi:hypothetical protein